MHANLIKQIKIRNKDEIKRMRRRKGNRKKDKVGRGKENIKRKWINIRKDNEEMYIFNPFTPCKAIKPPICKG